MSSSSYHGGIANPERPFASQLEFNSSGRESDPKHHTDSNFYNMSKEVSLKQREKRSNRDEFPQVMAKLMESHQGSWAKNGNEFSITNFLKADVLTTPKYHFDEKAAESLMKMRTDSSGMPVRRTFLGTSEQFFDAEAMIAKREIEELKKQGLYKKKASGIHGVLPTIVPRRESKGPNSSQMTGET